MRPWRCETRSPSKPRQPWHVLRLLSLLRDLSSKPLTVEYRIMVQGVSGDRAMPQRMGLFRLWQCILQFALILWIVRVAVAMTALGLLLLGLAPQAQDLFVEFADVPAWRMVLFV